MSGKVAEIFATVGAKVDGSLASAQRALGALADAGEKVGRSLSGPGRAATPIAVGLVGGLTAAVKAASSFNYAASAAADRAASIGRAMANEVAGMALPAFKRMTEGLADVVAWIRALSPAQREHIANWVTTAAEIAVAVVAVGKFSRMAVSLYSVGSALVGVFAGIDLPILAGVAALGAMALVVGYIYKHAQDSCAGIVQFGQQVASVITDVVTTWISNQLQAVDLLAQALDLLLSNFNIKIGKNGLADLFETFTKTTFDPGKLLKLGKDAGTTIADGIKDAMSGLKDMMKDLGITSQLDQFMDKAKQALGLDKFKSGAGKTISGPVDHSDEPDTHLMSDGQWWQFSAPKTARADAVSSDEMLAQQNVGFGDSLTVIANNTVQKIITEQAKKLAEAIAEATQNFKDRILSSLGTLGELAKAAQNGAQWGGWIGALVEVFVSILAKSQQFQQLMAMIEQIIQQVANVCGRILSGLTPVIGAVSDLFSNLFNALGPLFDSIGSILQNFAPILEVFASVFKLLAPVFQILGQVIQAVIPIVKMLYPVMQGLGLVLGGIVLALSAIVFGIEKLVESVLWVATQFATGPAKANIEKIKAQLKGMEVNLPDILKSLGDLANMNFDDAMSKATDSADTLATSLQSVADVINAPDGFKVNLERWMAINTGAGGTPTASTGGLASTVLGTLGTVIGSPVVATGGGIIGTIPVPHNSDGDTTGINDNYDWKLPHGSGNGNLTATPTTNVGELHIHINGITDPDEVALAVQKKLTQKNLARTGASYMQTTRFA